MAETLDLPPPPEPDAPLDAEAIRSRFERLAAAGADGASVTAAAVPEAEEDTRVHRSKYEVVLQKVNAWDTGAAALRSDALDAYLEWLREEVSSYTEENHKLSAEIGRVDETSFKESIQSHRDMEALEYSLKKVDSEALKQLEASPVIELCQTAADKDCEYEVLELDCQVEKSEMDLKLLDKQNSSLQRAEAIWQLESMLSEAKFLDFKDNCLRVFLKAPVLTSECLMYGQKLGCAVDSFVDHELLIEVDEGSKALKTVQIFPDDVCVDMLTEKLKSSREIIYASSVGWLIRQLEHHIIINSVRRSLVNDANNSRHSFEYFAKDETIVAHLAGGIDAFISISADWPLSSYGLKLVSISSSGRQQTNITFTLLCKTKELANVLELQTRRHLVKFVDAIEDILFREIRSQLHSSSSSS